MDIKDTSTSIFSEVGAFTESQEAVEAPINQTENAKVDIDTSDFSNRIRYVYQLDSLNRVFTENFWEIFCNFVESVRARLHETRSELKPV